MRELHGYQGEHRRHGRHAGDAAVPARDATTDAQAGRAPDVLARDSPQRAAQDALKLEMLTDPAARKAYSLRYSQTVEATNAEYTAKHAKLKPVDRAHPEAKRSRSRHELQGPAPEHAPPEARDKPASGIGRRSLPEQKEAAGQPRRERSWLPRADAVKAVTDTVMVGTATAVALGIASAKWEAVAASGAAAIVSHITLANRRRKEKHGDRPEG